VEVKNVVARLNSQVVARLLACAVAGLYA